MSGPDSSNGVKIFGMNLKVGGSSSPSVGRDIFCLKNFNTLASTSVHASKINAVAQKQLAFQMLT